MWVYKARVFYINTQLLWLEARLYRFSAFVVILEYFCFDNITAVTNELLETIVEDMHFTGF